jgi:hypothetical protein
MRAQQFSSLPMPPKLDTDSATERVQLVTTAAWMERLEEWRRKQPRIPSKSEAIRMLVEKALEAEGE